ncbi:hypothetical protein KBY67_11480 [Synechococcus sp. RedBA-s]|nr:hypothetical protein [Synechococcus sp. RedBA-s]MCP9801374.1 hypothetical protein [Synechococcus sp. RedBA-s]
MISTLEETGLGIDESRDQPFRQGLPGPVAHQRHHPPDRPAMVSKERQVAPQGALFSLSNRLVCLISIPFNDQQCLQRLLIAENLAIRRTDGQEWDLQVRMSEGITCVVST